MRDFIHILSSHGARIRSCRHGINVDLWYGYCEDSKNQSQFWLSGFHNYSFPVTYVLSSVYYGGLV
jgi:hypothetical protein